MHRSHSLICMRDTQEPWLYFLRVELTKAHSAVFRCNWDFYICPHLVKVRFVQLPQLQGVQDEDFLRDYKTI